MDETGDGYVPDGVDGLEEQSDILGLDAIDSDEIELDDANPGSPETIGPNNNALFGLMRRFALKDPTRAAEIRGQIINNNTRLIYSMMYNHFKRWISERDEGLMSAGYEGLILAVDKFDLDRGYKFSTYASRLIISKMSGYLRSRGDEIGEIGSTYRQKKAVATINRLVDNFCQEHHHQPSGEELHLLAEQVVPLGEVNKQQTLEKVERRRREMIDFLLAIRDTRTLQSDQGSDGSDGTPRHLPLAETISGDDDTNESALAGIDREQAIKLLSRLDVRDRDIVGLRLGLIGGREHTLEEIGKRHSLTRQRIDQLYKLAIGKMNRWAKTQRR